MKLKRLLALLMILCLTLCLCPAMAEETEAEDTTATEDAEQGPATNPYTFQAMDATIDLPAGLTVTDEQASETSVVLTLAMDGRTDVNLSLSIAYVEAYEGYTAPTLSDELLEQLVEYYGTNFTGGETPCVATVEDEAYAPVTPFMAGGKGSDGNLYSIYIMINDGTTMTVSGGIAADQFDYEAYGMIYNLYWQGVDMFINMA